MYKISLITGDGIGPELSESAISVLNTIQEKYGIEFEISKLIAGDKALEQTGKALPDDVVETIKNSDVCLKAPVGESAADVIVVLRRMLDLYANIRPSKSYPHMPALRDDIDMVIVRENTEDLYTGKEFSLGDSAVALRIISEDASKRIAKYAFETAKQRNSMKKVTCVHKSNVMRVTDGLFAKTCIEVSKDYPEIEFEEMYVDACAMNLIRQPEKFDVVVTTNLFGDILSDIAATLSGSIGMLPSASLNSSSQGMYEPCHGSAPDIAGMDIANPIAMIASLGMALKYSLDQKELSDSIDRAIKEFIAKGYRTKDISTNDEYVKTSEVASILIGILKNG